MKFLRNHKAQSSLEYALIIAVVVGALIAMQIYIKRGVQGRLRSSVDNVGDQYSAGNTTSKTITMQIAPEKTRESFGLNQSRDFSKAEGKGVTYSNVEQTAKTLRTTGQGSQDGQALQGANEVITKTLKQEALIDQAMSDKLYD